MVAFLVAIGLVVSGCGGSSGKSSSTASSGSTGPTGPSPGAPPGATRLGPGGPPGTAPAGSQPTHGIGARVLRRGELRGFAIQSAVSTATSGTSFASAEGISADRIQKEAARLSRAGFRAGAIEHLSAPAGAEGLSVVERLRSPASARAEVAFAATPQPGTRQTDFAVPAVPGARGFEASGGPSSGHNIAFAVGSYYYLVGVGWPTVLQHPPSRAQLVTAAQQLYKRVHG
jgi:hypothetical protein